MHTYVQFNAGGEIIASGDWEFPGSVVSEKSVERGWDGKLYFVDAIPAKPLATAQGEKRQEINRAHGEVLSYLLAESLSSTAVEAALAVEDMRSDDPEGLAYVRGLADARRAELLAAVDAAGTLGEVAAIVVSYPV